MNWYIVPWLYRFSTDYGNLFQPQRLGNQMRWKSILIHLWLFLENYTDAPKMYIFLWIHIFINSALLRHYVCPWSLDPFYIKSLYKVDQDFLDMQQFLIHGTRIEVASAWNHHTTSPRLVNSLNWRRFEGEAPQWSCLSFSNSDM